MKKIQFTLFAFAIALLSACGSSTQNNDSHEHSDGCTHSQNSKMQGEEPQQESFTVEADSTHAHTDSCSHKNAKTHSHKHADGKDHTH